MNNNLKAQLMELLKTSSGQKAKNDLKNMNMSEIEKRLMHVNKDEVIKKLYDMNMGSVAKKVESMSNEEIINLLKQNPGFINLLEML